MITDTLLNGLKSLFSTLGAKTSDSNYAVGLFDKTSGEPKGMMEMANLASVLGGQSTDSWRNGIFARYMYQWQSVPKTLKLDGAGICIVAVHHVNNIAAAYLIYQPDGSSFVRNGYKEIFCEGTTIEFNMYMDTDNKCFYFKGNGGGIQIGILKLCGSDSMTLTEVSTDVSGMTKIF